MKLKTRVKQKIEFNCHHQIEGGMGEGDLKNKIAQAL